MKQFKDIDELVAFILPNTYDKDTVGYKTINANRRVIKASIEIYVEQNTK